MNRREFIKMAGAVASSFMLAGAGCQSGRGLFKQKKTNVILIMADDLGFECLSCYGSLSYNTPVLDSLAANGVKFNRCYAQPLCTPSRVKIMTGRYNLRNYVQFGVLDPKEKTFAHLFKDAGYATCVAGKWQLNSGHRGTMPQQAGFDEHCLWQLNIRGSRYADPTFTRNGEEIENVEGAYGPNIYMDFVLDFIDRKKDGPFMVYLPMALTHAPFEPTPDSPDWQKVKDVSEKPYFKDMVEYMDKLIGKLTEKLDALGLRDNTLVMFTGDNGTPRAITTRTTWGSIKGAKAHTHEYGIHVPLIVSWPGTAAEGYVCDDLIDFADMLPTMADAAAIPVPAEYPIDGRSFLPQIKGEKGNPKDYIFMDYDPKQGKNLWPPRRFIMGKRYKLYDNGEFYDLKNDIMEEKPLADADLSEQAKQIKARYRAVLDQYKGMKSPDLE